MREIYLIGKNRFKGVKNINLTRIKFHKFSVNLSEFDALIISSKNALKALQKAKILLKFSGVLYAVGQESANLAKRLGFKDIKSPAKSYGIKLASEFKDELKDKKILYLRAEKIASNLDEILMNLSKNFSQIIVYKNEFKAPKKPINLSHPAVFIFSAPSAVRNFLTLYTLKSQDIAVCIGQSTALSLQEKVPNFKNIKMPEIPSIKNCVKMARNLASLDHLNSLKI